jgi:farnesyl-diphosphate farnesyltransferase
MSAHSGTEIPNSADDLLRSVSRSFYLSIRILPASLREPVALGYLLARTTDTVADTAQISGVVRIETLRQLSGVIQDGTAPKTIVDLASSFSPFQQHRAERVLIEALPQTLQQLQELNVDDREAICGVLANITRGQLLDLQRFDSSKLRALETTAELDEYTYLVAGSVGEFWTRLCFRHIRNFSRRSETDMLALGKRYGMGLQLINVLRDAGADLRTGRCYFPNEQLRAVGMTASDILREPLRFQPICDYWIDKAESGITAGVAYSSTIQNRRVRAATLLPALIGQRTLALLRAAGEAAFERTIKVPRPEVRKLIVRALFSSARAVTSQT